MFLKKILKYKNKCSIESHELISEIEKIEEESVDEEKSSIFQSNSFIHFIIYSKGNISYPFFLDIGIEDEVNKYFIGFGFDDNRITEVYYENINDRDMMTFYRTFLNYFLSSNIVSKETIVNGKIISIDLYADKLINQKRMPQHLGRKNKPIWFWQKREIKKTQYVPWLK